jgi:hypothetical protein
MQRSLLWLALVAAPACSDLPQPAVGQLQLGLASGFGDERYRLASASFDIEGATTTLSLGTEDDATSDTLQRALPQGDYSVRLRDGWQLERLSSAGATLVAAELSSENPIPFSILAGELTTVTFQFRTRGGDAAPPEAGGDGEVRIGIEVDGASSPAVLISELMKNPETLPDADGEWLELFNAGSAPVDLGGCTLSRDDQDLALDSGVSLAPGAYLTFANGDAPGFAPDVLYSGLTLPNSGAFVLRLACGAQLLDEVHVDPAAPPQRAGHSLSLSGGALDAISNDDVTRWCEGTGVYNGDFGTPGGGNPDCGG